MNPIRAVITNFGTMGDVRPMLALGEELQACGHRPLVALPPFSRPFAKQLNLAFRPLGPDLLPLQEQINLALSTSPGLYDSQVEMLQLLEPLQKFFGEIFDDLRALCEGADVLVIGPALPFGKIIHELTGIPFVGVQFSNFGGNGGNGFRYAGEHLINPFRSSLGLRPIRDPFTTGANSEQLTLYAMTKYLRPRPADWPSHYHLTGFFFERGHHVPDADLQSFVENGDPPVVITFGSMVSDNPRKRRELVIEAIRLTGCRAVIQGMSDDFGRDESRPIYWSGFVPHSGLFPRASCVVLHGGGGTAGAVFRAGVPAIFVPHGECYDQFYWAKLAEEKGCAGPTILSAELNEHLLADAINRVQSTSSFRTSAAQLSKQIQSEQGVRLARRLIENLVGNVGLQR